MNWVADDLGLQVLAHLDDVPRHQVLVVDDLIDSGATAARYEGGPFDALYRKSVSPEGPQITLDGWLVFPWEHGEETGPTDAVVRLLQHIGEDPRREGLLDTPKRVVKAFSEMTSGYSLDPAEILGTTFDIGDCDQLVVVSGIEFTSLCEHHMLPFTGTASVGYLPAARVVGLSKLARLVDLYAQRLQVQERMTTQIAQAIMDHLDARAAGVIIRGAHSCMSCRGVRKTSVMTTSAMFGELRDNPVMRTEFMGLER
jgi:GTP cyclohydrolase I